MINQQWYRATHASDAPLITQHTTERPPGFCHALSRRDYIAPHGPPQDSTMCCRIPLYGIKASAAPTLTYPESGSLPGRSGPGPRHCAGPGGRARAGPGRAATKVGSARL